MYRTDSAPGLPFLKDTIICLFIIPIVTTGTTVPGTPGTSRRHRYLVP
jgi:hypothetical protein